MNVSRSNDRFGFMAAQVMALTEKTAERTQQQEYKFFVTAIMKMELNPKRIYSAWSSIAADFKSTAFAVSLSFPFDLPAFITTRHFP